MKLLAATCAAVMLVVTAAAAGHAGVVVHEREIVNRGKGQPVTHERTVMIEGNKQKMITGKEIVVTDLDNGMMYMFNPSAKTYIALPFPPRGRMAAMMAGAGPSTLNFKKTGGRQTVAGYSCDNYAGDGNMMGNKYSVNGCFSTKAPGASDFTAFQKRMQEKVKGTPMEMSGNVPDGVPLKLDSTTRLTHVSVPGMSADQAAKLNQMLANRPPVVTDTTVTKIARANLTPDTFAVPAGYTKQEFRMPHQGAGANNTPPAGANKVPE
ncbi:MAG: DUF4412 domain-containing protein [Candidatus Binataceae bacterium]